MDKTRVNYIVDEKNGVVVAEINNCRYDAIEKLNSRFIPNTTSGITVFPTGWFSKFAMNNKYRAVAKKHPDDEWNETTGKREALNKLTDIYEAALNRRLALFMQKFDRIVGEVADYLSDKKF